MTECGQQRLQDLQDLLLLSWLTAAAHPKTLVTHNHGGETPATSLEAPKLTDGPFMVVLLTSFLCE